MFDYCSQATFSNSELSKKLRREGGTMTIIKIRKLNRAKSQETEIISGLKETERLQKHAWI